MSRKETYTIGTLIVNTLATITSLAVSGAIAVVGAITAASVTVTGAVAAASSAISGAVLLSGGAATAAVVARLGKTVTEGLELKVYDEVLTLTNAVTLDTGCVIAAGDIILSVQGNIDVAVTGDGGGGAAVAKIGIGIKGGDEDAYAEFAAMVKDTKANAIPDWAVNSGETLAIFGLRADGATAATEEFAVGGKVRVRVAYLTPNSLDNVAA